MGVKLMLIILAVVASIAKSHRLTGTVIPTKYQLHLNLSDSLFTATNDIYTGIVIIDCLTTEPTDNITLHASPDFITIKLISVGNTDSTSYEKNTTTDVLTIKWPSLIAANISFQIYIEFESRLSTTDMYGFYKSSYVDDDGSTKYVATTQFQPTFARRAFPCFDEPSYKATFNIIITHPKNLTALSNQPGTITDVSDMVGFNPDQATTEFNTTTNMSTYLIAFVVSEFTCTSGEDIEENLIPYQVCSRNDTNLTREFAVDIGPKLLRSLNDFTGLKYSEIGIDKMDQVAIPDFAAGAMENWGLVTYREALLLWDKNESTNADLENVATIISHEFAHQWFGNLVTNNWWAELFLNEGFATYFQFFTTHDVLPEWELDKQFILQCVHRAMEADAFNTSHALQHNVSSAAEVLSRFSTISYQKGGSILRMVEHIMGTENFKKGLQDYLKAFSHKSTLPEDLWTALNATVNDTLSQLPANLSTIMENWVKNPGYPVIDVAHVGVSIVISQPERFLLSGNDTSSKWYVPLTYTLSTDDALQFLNTSPRAWMEPVGVVELDGQGVDWIILNNQASGFYRVNYDDSTWTNIVNALNSTNFTGIPDLTRAQLVDDAFAFARSNKRNYSSLLNFLDFLQNDDSIYSWTPALNGFHTVLRRVGYDSRLGVAMKNHLITLLRNISASVPFNYLNESDHAYTMKQTTVLSTACRVGQNACVEQALERFGEFRINGIRPPKNLRSVIYCNALRYNTENPEEDWYLLWDLYTTTELASEKVRILNALGCTTNETLLKQYLNVSLNEHSGIRPQDAINVFTSVYTSNDVGVNVAFEFLRENHQLIAERYQSMNALRNLITGIASRFTTAQQVEELRWFIQLGGLEDDFRAASLQALATAESNMEWLANNREELHEFYGLPLEEEEVSSTPTSSSNSSDSTTEPNFPSGYSSHGMSNYAMFLALVSCIVFKFNWP